MLSIMIWEFIQNQILGMKWMSTLIGNLLEKIGLDTSSRMGGSVQFFLYDVWGVFMESGQTVLQHYLVR